MDGPSWLKKKNQIKIKLKIKIKLTYVILMGDLEVELHYLETVSYVSTVQ